MGLFSSKKKTTVHTEVQRMVEDNQLPASAKSAVIEYILKDGDRISNHLLNKMVESVAVRAERMYAFAKRGDYFYGLPQATGISPTQGKVVVTQTLEDIEGQPIALDYYHFGPLNNIHVGWQTLIADHGYDVSSNEITSLSALLEAKVYLQDMIAVYTQATLDAAEPGTLDVWGNAPSAGYTPERVAMGSETLHTLVKPSPYQVDTEATQDYVRVLYVYLKDEVLQQGSFDIPVIDTHPDEDGDYHHVRYRVGGAVKYWRYLQGSGLYPAVDTIYKTSFTEMGTYFPWIYYRHDQQSRVSENVVGDPAYVSSIKLCKYLGIDFVEFGTAIHENPGIDDVEQAMTIMAVAANSEDEVDRKYLYEYFGLMYHQSSGASQSALNALASSLGYDPATGRTISLRDKEFHMVLRFQGMTRKRIAGTVAKVGGYAGGSGDGCHVYQKQVARGFYDEIKVYGLKTTYAIWKDYSTSASGSSDKLLVPLDRSVASHFSLPDKEILYTRSLHNIFNTRVTTKTKWYQSGWFKWVMIIVSIVLTVIYPPGGAAMWAAIAAAGTVYLAMAVIATIIIQFAISAAIQLFAEAVGAEWAMVIAVIAIAYGGYQAIGKAGALSVEAVKSATANVFVKLGTSLGKAAMSVHQQGQIQDYNNELQQFELFKETQVAELEEMRKLLDTQSLIDPFELVAETPLIVWGELPQDMYSRTVHSGNIGVMTLDVPGSYVSNSLALPTFQHTVSDWEGGEGVA